MLTADTWSTSEYRGMPSASHYVADRGEYAPQISYTQLDALPDDILIYDSNSRYWLDDVDDIETVDDEWMTLEEEAELNAFFMSEIDKELAEVMEQNSEDEESAFSPSF